MVKLSKYTQAQNIAASDTTINDDNSPFTFKQWIERNIGILSDKQTIQYNNYIKRWYINKNNEMPTVATVKEDYINLLKQLTIAFKSDADVLWCSDINFDDPDELEQIIPFYATKLKEIAIYFINKREAIRHAKLKYNMTGTYPAIERIFHEYLLKAFTKRQFPGNEYITNVTDISVLNYIPDLSAVQTNFQLYVEELYDDASYFDRDPSLPVSAYFTFNDSATTYLDSLNITPSDYEWLYNTGVTQLCADNPLLWSVESVLNQYKNGIPLSAVELYDSDVLNDYNRIKLSQKYLGDTQYILSGGYWSLWADEMVYNLNQGNNWFYWASGENIFENDSSIIDPISLSSTNLIESGATAGTNILSADIIYVTRNDSISGAWLRLTEKDTFNATMSARLIKGKTIFAFPFPGYGLSGNGFLWSGKTLDNLDQTFFYLEKEDQNAVYSAYWNSNISSISSFSPLYINDTTLLNNGAKASEKFSEADFIITRDTFRDDNQDYIYTGKQQYAWLYKMQKTDLPINIGDNNLLWPFERFNTNTSMVASPDQCSPVSLSSISLQNFLGAVASLSSNSSDKIFKKKSPNSTNYKEGAWLRGNLLPQPINVTDSTIISGCYQPGIAIKILGDTYGTFIWTDSTKLADLVFNNIKHQNDCQYLKNTQFSLYNESPSQEKDLPYNQWQDCTCRSVLYSPLGHPGDIFDEYGGMSDFIVAINNPTSAFNLKDWRDEQGKTYELSNDFGWFKLNQQYSIEPDVGWGSGNWVTNTGDPFSLRANVMYIYFRNGMQRDDASSNVPYIITKYKNENTQAQWCKLYLNSTTNEWVESDNISDMILNPNDIFYYSHAGAYSFVLSSSHAVYNTQIVPIFPNLSSYGVTVNLDGNDLPITHISEPIQAITPMCTLSTFTLSTIGSVESDYYGMPSGSYTISASFDNLINTNLTTELSTIITEQIDYYTYTNEAIGFILNIPLSGWDYTNSIYSVSSLGAKPYWAVASDSDDEYTKRKSIDIWSGSPIIVDEYNFITQPPYSKMVFNTNTYIEYNKRDLGTIIWKQPVDVSVEKIDKKWCKIFIDTNITSNLSSNLYNNINDLVITASNIPSDLIFSSDEYHPLLINYYARNDITWIQPIFNSSLGLPPTGGVWHPISSESLIVPDAPYAHLSNRHFPTYASVPSIGELYSKKDKGGYFIPRLLGASTAISKNFNNVLDTSRIDNNVDKRGMSAVYRNLDIYSPDRGLSRNDQISPVTRLNINSDWMKASITEGNKAGLIVHTKEYQEFMPYQTKYECIGINDNGIFRQGEDAYDPWFGEYDNTWENLIDWPPNERKQYNIEGWYNQQNINDGQIYQWKTDIFGNHYALLKNNFASASIYDKKHNIGGNLWTRNARNQIQPASASLVEVFRYIPPAISSININTLVSNSSAILDMDVWFDTLMLYTSANILFFHLNFNYDTGIISSTSDEINYILTENSLYGGIWFFEEDKKITICTLLSCGDQIRPILRSLDLETNQMKYMYNISSTYTDTSNISLTSYEHPSFTYDNNTKTYNISYIGYGASNGMHLATINVRDYGEYYDIISSKIITPIEG